MIKDGDVLVTPNLTESDISLDEDEDEGSKFVKNIGEQYSSLKLDYMFWEEEKDFQDLLKYNDETEIEYSNVKGKIINMRKDTSKFIQIYNILKNFFFQNLIEILKLTDEQKTEQTRDLETQNNRFRESIRREIIDDLKKQITDLRQTNYNNTESISSQIRSLETQIKDIDNIKLLKDNIGSDPEYIREFKNYIKHLINEKKLLHNIRNIETHARGIKSDPLYVREFKNLCRNILQFKNNILKKKKQIAF